MSEHKYFDDGGPAFPVPEQNRLSDGTCCNEGMTLRDWFAGQALAGLNGWVPGHQFGLSDPEGIKVRSDWAYAHADAMIASRKACA